MSILENSISGLFALAGGALVWLLQSRDRAKERAERRSALLREKAELIFMELGRLGEENRGRLTAAVQYAKDSMAFPLEASLLVDTGRLLSLLNMYFPTLTPLALAHEEASKVIAQRFREELMKSIQEGESAQLDSLILAMAVDYNWETSRFASTVRRELTKLAPALLD